MTGDLRTVAIGEGRSIGFVEHGDPSGRALVLVHGFPLGVRMWDPQRDAFAGWRVVVPALAGFNGTEPPPDPSMDGYAGDVLRLLDRLGIDRAVFAGLSMGGYVAFGVRRLAPARMMALVLADTRSVADTEEGRAARREMRRKLDQRGPAAVADDMMPKLFGRTSHATRPHLIAQMREMIEAQSAAAVAAAIRALADRPDSTPLLPLIDIPTLVLVGEEDTLTPPSDSERMHALIPGSRLVRVPAAGHMSNMEAPDAFNRAVREFLDGLTN